MHALHLWSGSFLLCPTVYIALLKSLDHVIWSRFVAYHDLIFQISSSSKVSFRRGAHLRIEVHGTNLRAVSIVVIFLIPRRSRLTLLPSIVHPLVFGKVSWAGPLMVWAPLICLGDLPYQSPRRGHLSIHWWGGVYLFCL